MNEYESNRDKEVMQWHCKCFMIYKLIFDHLATMIHNLKKKPSPDPPFNCYITLNMYPPPVAVPHLGRWGNDVQSDQGEHRGPRVGQVSAYASHLQMVGLGPQECMACGTVHTSSVRKTVGARGYMLALCCEIVSSAISRTACTCMSCSYTLNVIWRIGHRLDTDLKKIIENY